VGGVPEGRIAFTTENTHDLRHNLHLGSENWTFRGRGIRTGGTSSSIMKTYVGGPRVQRPKEKKGGLNLNQRRKTLLAMKNKREQADRYTRVAVDLRLNRTATHTVGLDRKRSKNRGRLQASHKQPKVLCKNLKGSGYGPQLRKGGNSVYLNKKRKIDTGKGLGVIATRGCRPD